MHVLLFGMSCVFMFKMIAAWSEMRNAISVCAACVNIILHVLHPPFCLNLSFVYVKMYHNDVLRTCVACPWYISKRLKPQDSPHVTYCSTDVSSECHETLLILCTQFSICYQSTMSLVILKTVKQGFCMCAL